MKILLILAALVGAASARNCVCVATWGGGTVNVRACASTTCTILFTASAGECGDYIATSGSWYHISMRGYADAYIHSDYVSGPQTCGGGGTGSCFANMCASYATNTKRTCDSYGCGNFGASRGSRAHTGWDVRCNGAGTDVYAPFGGTLVRKAYPYGDGSCCDTGFLLSGSGVWAGYEAMVFYCEPIANLLTGTVLKGQHIADHKSLHCGCYGIGMQDHVHIQIDYFGARIDPASWLFDC